MEIFEFYWSDYDEHCPYLFEHINKTKEEFEADCKRAMIESFNGYMEQEHGWAGVSDWVKYSCKKLEEYGYKKVCPITFGFFGGYIVKEIDQIEDENLMVFPEQLEQMEKHNTIFDKELYKDLYE